MLKKGISRLIWAWLPNTHVLWVAVLIVPLLGVWVAGPAPDQRANAASVSDERTNAASLVGVLEPEIITSPPAALAPAVAVAAPAPPPPAMPDLNANANVILALVLPGDSLAQIFKRHGFGDRELQLVRNSEPLGKRLDTIYAGHRFEFTRDPRGNLLGLKYQPGKLETLEFKRQGDGFESVAIIHQPEAVSAYQHATIDRSLFAACQKVGLDDAFATRLAKIFQWDIDFILESYKGDEFYVLYNEHYIDGEFVGFGDILAAEIVNRGTSYKAVRYIDNTGAVDYYSPNGENMRKAFLRTPVEFSRISSRFNLKRVHPLRKSSMPHRGIDYAAPVGTEVKAAGAGRVVTASYSAANGNYVVIQHGHRYQTKYLHLARRANGLRKGQRVTQGQTIGYVGATGWATGPHLHYEFLVDGAHKNPRTALLPKAEPIVATERNVFDASTAPLLAELEYSKTIRQLAYQHTGP